MRECGDPVTGEHILSLRKVEKCDSGKCSQIQVHNFLNAPLQNNDEP